MYKLCQTEQSAARQRELEQGLLGAMETTRYEELTISQLCQQMGIPRKSFYRYFGGKDGALHALIDHTLLDFDMMLDVLDEHTTRNHRTSLELFFRFWFSQKRLLDALARSSLGGVLVERAVNQALEENQVPTRYLFMDNQGIRGHAVSFAVTGLMSMVLHWHAAGYHLTPQQMAQIAVNILTVPMFPEDFFIK